MWEVKFSGRAKKQAENLPGKVLDRINGDFVSDHYGVLTEIRAVSSMPGGLLLLCLGLLAMAGLGGKFKQN